MIHLTVFLVNLMQTSLKLVEAPRYFNKRLIFFNKAPRFFYKRWVFFNEAPRFFNERLIFFNEAPR